MDKMPNRAQIHIDRALTNVSVAYMQNADNFIADKVFPIIPVQKQSDLYFKYVKDDFFRDEAALRADGSESAGGDYDVEHSEPYYCRVYAFHKDVTEQERVNSDEPLNVDQDATEFVSQKLLLKREVLFMTNFFKSGVWNTEITGVDATPAENQVLKWTNPLSDPIGDITNANVRMAEETSYRPNTLVLSPWAFYALKNHPDILERIKYTQKGIVTTDLLATLFEVERVFIAWGVQNTKAKGADGELSFIMGKHALLCYTPKSAGLKTPAAGYTFAWKGYMGAAAYGNRIVRIPMPWLGLETERIEAEMAFDMKQICADMGVFFNNIVDDKISSNGRSSVAPTQAVGVAKPAVAPAATLNK